ncbi:MAG: nucleotide exchange factor GrpE [Candidatus Paceibacterales bacterium]
MEKKKPTLEEIKQKLEECQKSKDEYLTGWQRARADFLNYKKGELERVGELIKYADTGLILKFLPILDNFEIVEKKLPEDLKNDESVKGLLQLKTQIRDFLKGQGVEEIESLGKKFDPNFMEVIEMVEPASASASAEATADKAGIVIEEIQKGYKIHDKLLRPAKVRVSK